MADELTIKGLLNFAASEKERIFRHFFEQDLASQPSNSKFIQMHQAGVSSIIDRLMRNVNADGDNPSSPSVYRGIAQECEEILLFLRQHFSEQFDKEMPISALNVEASKKKLNEALHGVVETTGIDRRLLKIATRPIREFVDEGRKINYRELDYLIELLSCLRSIADFDANPELAYEMHIILIQLNFNYPRYVLYYCNWIDMQLAEIPDRTARLDKLLLYLHSIEQIRVKPGLVLIPGLPSITDQLLASIRTTYGYLWAENDIQHKVIEEMKHDSVRGGGKIKLAVSVPVLALFIKVLIKAGIIVNENKSAIFRIVAANFSTVKSNDLSSDSLRGKYTKPAPSAYIHLKKTLTHIIQLIREV